MSANQDKWFGIAEEIWNKGRLDAIDEMVDPDMIEHATVPPGVMPGRQGFVQIVQMLRQAFPDLQYEVDRTSAIDAGDMQAASATVRATHTGEFMGMPPTGKQVTWQETHIGRFEGGKVKEHWGVADMLSVFSSLGWYLRRVDRDSARR